MAERDVPVAEGILFTDEYEFTMAQLYYRFGLHEVPAVFDYFFRDYPAYNEHRAGYCVNAGLEWLMRWMERARFTGRETALMRSQTTRAGDRLYDDDFLGWLEEHGEFSSLSMRAVPEGRVVHPNTPLVTVQGPMAMAQILESSLVNQLSYQTLIATKAARIKQAGRGGLLLEFGLRRAQGTGANAGVRGALIGGADFSSNAGISYELGYPPKGTHAHSMVQLFMALGEGELGAFRAYADVYPDDCILLVDTIDTIHSGLPNAIKVFEELKRKGHKPVGIRLDSGDLAHLSIRAAKILDDGGFPDTTIVLSNQLDELVLWQVVSQIEDEAPGYGLDPDQVIGRLAYGAGTRLITSEGHQALDGVYKLVAVEHGATWQPAIKLSETVAKTLNPGRKNLYRIYDDRGYATADLVSEAREEPSAAQSLCLRHPQKEHISRTLSPDCISAVEPLLEDVQVEGQRVYDFPSIEQIRARRDKDLDRLDVGVKRLLNPHRYHVSVTEDLWQRKTELARSFEPDAAE